MHIIYATNMLQKICYKHVGEQIQMNSSRKFHRPVLTGYPKSPQIHLQQQHIVLSQHYGT